MANERDVAEAIARLSHGLAKAVDEAPTGVVPGFRNGVAYLPNGRARYVGTAASGGTLLAEARILTSMTSATDGQIINFDDVNYGALITTGASWSIALAAGWYQVVAGFRSTRTPISSPRMSIGIWRCTTSPTAAQLDTIDRLQHPTQINGGVSTSDFFLSGSVVFNIASAITARCRFQTNQFTFGVDRTIGGGRFALIQLGT
jgi:hypothetical protein